MIAQSQHPLRVLWNATMVIVSLACAGSYGNLARFTDLRRIRRIGDYTLLGASGEYSDFQSIMDILDKLMWVSTV
jgi:20S proteasome subunit beta 7